MKDLILKFLLLNIDSLKGTRTLTGLLLYLGPEMINHLLDSSFCTTHAQACFWIKAAGIWFAGMGIRGAVAGSAPNTLAAP